MLATADAWQKYENPNVSPYILVVDFRRGNFCGEYERSMHIAVILSYFGAPDYLLAVHREVRVRLLGQITQCAYAHSVYGI